MDQNGLSRGTTGRVNPKGHLSFFAPRRIPYILIQQAV